MSSIDISGFFLEGSEVGDYPFQQYSFTRGEVYYFDSLMSIHPNLTENFWTSRQVKDFSRFCKSRVEEYNNDTDKRYDQCIKDEISSMLSGILFRAKELTEKQFYEICEKLDQSSMYRKHKYYVELVKTIKQYYDLTYLDGRIVEFSKENRYVLIWGAGYYGKSLSEQFVNNGVEFDGFVISDKQIKSENYLGKKYGKK